jgi:hypothetical protein
MRAYAITLIELPDGVLAEYHVDDLPRRPDGVQTATERVMRALVDKLAELQVRRVRSIPAECATPKCSECARSAEIAAAAKLATAAIDEQERGYDNGGLCDTPERIGVVHHLANEKAMYKATAAMLHDDLLDPLYERLRSLVEDRPMKYVTVLAAVDKLLAERARLAPKEEP